MNRYVSSHLEKLRASPPPSGDPVLGTRAFFEGLNNLYPPRDVAFTDRTVQLAGRVLTLRCYNPNTSPKGGILFLHGGGFLAGSLNSHDGLCRHLATATGTTVMALDYRLAPEHPHPAALEDAIDTVAWILDNHALLHLDPDRLAVMGDSSGGYLAAQAALHEPRIALQILLYPVLDLTASSESHRRFAMGYGMDAPMIEFCYGTYAGPARHDPSISPLLAPLPPTIPPALIIVGEQDPLIDEARSYAERVRATGTKVTLAIAPDQVHGFISMPALFPDIGEYMDLVAKEYRATTS
jgi:acetyl esterase